MTNDSEIALSIRARILPMIEGSNEFFSQLEQTPQRITAPMQQLTQDPGFQQGLSPRQITNAQVFAGGEDVMEMQDYQAKIKMLRDEIAASMKASELSGHNLTKYDLFNMHKKMLKEQAALDDFQEKQLTAIDEMDLPKEKKEFMKEVLVSGIKDASIGLDELNPKLREMVEQMKAGGEAGDSLFAILKQGGYLALMGQAAHTAMDWTLSEARIEAKQLTGFNLTSPMSSYAATEEAKLFKETTERTREDKLIGQIAGAIAAIGLVAATGGAGAIPLAAMAAGGAMFGGEMGGMYAESLNIEDRAKLEADIKYRSQTLSKAEQTVQSAIAYEISKFKAEQRFGKDMGGTGEFGYSADETLELKKSFATQFGKMDEAAFREQTLFARERGLDPRQMYQFGEMERLTGNKLSYGEFAEVEKKSQQLFGTEVDKERVVDILKDIRSVAMKQLKAGIDTHDAIKFAVELPRMLMGTTSPYGRAGDLGAETSNAFERFGNPLNTAQEAILMSAWGENGMFGSDGYLSRRREGIMEPRNFRSAIEAYRKQGSGTDIGAQAIMEAIDPQKTMAKPIYDKLIDLFGEKGETQYDEYKLDKNGKRIPIKGQLDEKGEQKYEMESVTVKLEEFYKMIESQGKGLGEGGKEFLEATAKANNNVSVQEAHLTRMREMELETAKGLQATIFESQEKSAKFWEGMSHNTNVQRDMIETIRKGIDAQYLWMITSGIEKNPIAIENFLKEQKRLAYEEAGIEDPSKLSVGQAHKILKEQGYKEIEQQVIDAGAMPESMRHRYGDPQNRKPIKIPEETWKDGALFFDQDIKIPDKSRQPAQELTARLEGLETLNRTIDTLIFKFDSLGDKIELASLKQGTIKVQVESSEDVYGKQTNFIDDRA